MLGEGGPRPASVGNWAGEALLSDGQWPWRAALSPARGLAARPFQSRSTASSEHKGLRAAPGPTVRSGHGGGAAAGCSLGRGAAGWRPSARLPGPPRTRPWGWPSPSSAHCLPLAVGPSARMPTVMVVPVSAKGGVPVLPEDGGSRMFPEGHGGACGDGRAPSSGVGGMSLSSRSAHWWGRGPGMLESGSRQAAAPGKGGLRCSSLRLGRGGSCHLS